jgi:chromosome segregation protein
MLRFEKLFIQGFKSFCDPTEVLFDEEGITAVVGPNGCGKSNVADAISWVIGEQRAKALRGGKMEDVIFQGSRNRKPSGLAEVMLTLVVREAFEIKAEETPPPVTEVETGSTDEAAVPVGEVSTETDAASGSTSVPLSAGTSAGEAASGIPPEQAAPPEQPEQKDQPDQSEQPEQPEQPEQKDQKKKRRSAPPALQRIFTEGERITIGRRLYRTGESEYEMNGRQCRLRDVQDLFSGTGLGGAHYAIIEQGRIGQVLSAKPLDRRALIEEAAGVSKFKLRQHAAEMKLEASKQNLSRINDILIEIERQQNSLRRQAGKARRFRKLQQEMRDLMRAIFVVDYRVTNRTIIDRQSRLVGITEQEGAVNLERTRLEEEQTTVAQIARSAETSLNEVRQLAATVDLESERHRQQTTYLQDQIQTLSARRAQTDQEQASINERRGFLEQELLRLRGELQVVEEEINRESRTLTEAEEAHRQQTQQDQGVEGRLEEARKAAYEAGTLLERWRQLHRQFTESVDRSSEKIRGLGVEKERAHDQSRSATERYEELQQRVAESELRHEETGQRLEELLASLMVRRQRREELQKELNRLQRELTATEHRLRSLTELDQRRAYFSEAVQALARRDQSKYPFKVLGTLADYVNVDAGDESIIETSLREELQYVVVPTVADARAAIGFLNAEGAGRATFLVLAGAVNESLPPPTGGESTLGDRLGLKPEISSALRLALPGLFGARILAELPGEEWEHLSQTVLTGTGERIIAGRLITGGSRGEKALGVLALKREIEELTSRHEQLEEETGQTELQLEQVRHEVQEAEEEQRRLDGEQRQTDKQLAVLREQLQQCNRERERTGTHIRVVEQELAQALTEKEDFAGRLAHATDELQKAELARDTAATAVSLAQEEVAELRRLSEDRSQALSRRRAEFAARSERRRGYQNDLRRLESETQELKNRLGRLEFESLEINETVLQSRQTLETAREQLADLTMRQEQLAIELEERSLQMTAARDQYEAIEHSLREARETSTSVRETRAQLEIDLARLTTNLEYLIQTCHSELGENLVEVCERLDQVPAGSDEEARFHPAPSKALPKGDQPETEEGDEEGDDQVELSNDIRFWSVPENFDLELAKLRLAEVNSRIDSLGPINMMALEELAEVEERFHFLTAQKADLETAITDTLAAINEIRRRSKERFLEAFTQINENFKQMFQELFGGGTGEMRLIDQNDLLESGIEIIAQPPGKRLQNVLLLSGGEKAMAALSLIMAIFKYRPSPFCLLDEVDAPLDEMNISRFSDKVLQMSKNTQFMVITHSKRTMEAARTLYGVTMEDPGVSKLISVKLT